MAITYQMTAVRMAPARRAQMHVATMAITTGTMPAPMAESLPAKMHAAATDSHLPWRMEEPNSATMRIRITLMPARIHASTRAVAMDSVSRGVQMIFREHRTTKFAMTAI